MRVDGNLIGGCLSERVNESPTHVVAPSEMAIAIISFIKASGGTVEEQGHYHYGPLPLIRVVIVIIM